MSPQTELTMAEHCFFDYAEPRRFGCTGNLTCEASAYLRAQEDWQSLVAAAAAQTPHLDDFDAMICDADSLARMIDETGDVVVRQSLRMVAEMRKFTIGAGVPFAPSEKAREIFQKADREWDQQLDLHPVYTKWLLLTDLVACTRLALVEALDRAPSEVIRHAVREVLAFRDAFELAHGRVFR